MRHDAVLHDGAFDAAVVVDEVIVRRAGAGAVRVEPLAPVDHAPWPGGAPAEGAAGATWPGGPAPASAGTARSSDTGSAAGDPAADYSVADLERGLDSLQDAPAREPRRWRRALGSVLLPVACLVVLVLVWQGYVWLADPRPDIVPSPAAVWQSFGQLWQQGRLQQAVLTSLQRGVFGFLIAVAIGTPVGLLLAEVPLLRRSFGPLISGLQVLPSVAWVPAAILWFGLSDATAYFVVLMGATPSIVNGLLSGIDQVPPQFRRVGTVLGANRAQQAGLVVLPAALPGYLGGLKQGWAFSWRSLMAAEIITVGGTMGFGLGTLLEQSRELADLPGVIVTIVAILAVGIVVELLVFAPIERRLARGRGLAVAGARP